MYKNFKMEDKGEIFMVELNSNIIEDVIYAIRISFLENYLGVSRKNLSSLLNQEISSRFDRGLCSIFAITMKQIIPSAQFGIVDGIFGNHVFVNINDEYYDIDGQMDPLSLNLWSEDEKNFGASEVDIMPYLPKDYFEQVSYYTEMIDTLSNSGKEVLKEKGINHSPSSHL